MEFTMRIYKQQVAECFFIYAMNFWRCIKWLNWLSAINIFLPICLAWEEHVRWILNDVKKKIPSKLRDIRIVLLNFHGKNMHFSCCTVSMDASMCNWPIYIYCIFQNVCMHINLNAIIKNLYNKNIVHCIPL